MLVGPYEFYVLLSPAFFSRVWIALLCFFFYRHWPCPSPPVKASLRSAHSFQSSSLLPFRDLGFNFIINCSLILFSDVSQHLFCLIDDAKVRQFSAPDKFFANNYPRYMRQGCECATDGRHGLESCRSSGNTWGLERCVTSSASMSSTSSPPTRWKSGYATWRTSTSVPTPPPLDCVRPRSAWSSCDHYTQSLVSIRCLQDATLVVTKN